MMMDRDSITRTGARTSRVGGIFRLMAVRNRVCGPTQCGTTVVTTRCTKGGYKLSCHTAYAGSRLKLNDVPGRSRLIRQP